MTAPYDPTLKALVVSMKESSTYQAILEEGRTEGIAKGIAKGIAEGIAKGKAEEAKKVLRLQGEQRFGPPDAATVAAMEQIDDLVRLEELLRRVLVAGNWPELFGPPSSGRRSRRRPSS